MRSAFAFLVLLVLALAAPGCGSKTEEQRADRLQEGLAKLESDPSAALFIARDALSRQGEDPRLRLLAAMACLRLERRSNALEYADQGLQSEDLDDDLKADLQWARGTALAGRYHEVHDLSDWRAANTSLELATAAGGHRVQAATLLVALQDMSNLGTTDRQLKYARLVLQLEPDGKNAASVRALLESKGLKP
jgi:hypothetical protein